MNARIFPEYLSDFLLDFAPYKTAEGGFDVEMMGLIGAGNNPMVGMTVACAVAVEEGMNK